MKDSQPKKIPMHAGAGGYLFETARQLRIRQTKAEQLLWSELSNKKLGVKFRRQHPIYDYVVDFYCHEVKLVIEVDGPVHDLPDNKLYDASRTQLLMQFGLSVVRFKNEEIVNDIDKVLATIKEHISPFRARRDIFSINVGPRWGRLHGISVKAQVKTRIITARHVCCAFFKCNAPA
jgi:very-short-patch-repair endonuclease